jgi:hypothetical protein
MNCENIVESYLLSKCVLVQQKYLIALFLSIIMFIYVINTYKFDQYMEQIIIPLLTFIVVLVIIDVVSKMMINNEEKDRLVKLCQLWINDPNTQNNPRFKDQNGLLFVNMNAVSNYNGIIEGFEQNGNCQSSPDLKENEKVIDTSKENNDNTQTVFPSDSNVPVPHNDINEVHHIMESGDSLIRNKAPFGSESVELSNDESCLFGTSCGAICSTKNTKAPCVAPVPGPQWQPQSAESVQQRLANKNYTKNSCI